MKFRKSRNMIRRELEDRGVTEEEISQAFDEVPYDEQELIDQLILKKAGEPHVMDDAGRMVFWHGRDSLRLKSGRLSEPFRKHPEDSFNYSSVSSLTACLSDNSIQSVFDNSSITALTIL